MKSKNAAFGLVIGCVISLGALVGCGSHSDPAAEAPPPATVIPGVDLADFAVEHPD